MCIFLSILGTKLSRHDLVDNWQCVILQPTDFPLDMTHWEHPFFHSNLPRQESLLVQSSVVAHDEMGYYLNALGQTEGVAAVPPLVLCHCRDVDLLLAFWMEEIIDAKRVTKFISAVLLDGHWRPVMVTKGAPLKIISAEKFAKTLCAYSFPFKIEVALVHIGQVFSHDCGFQAFATLTTWLKDSTQNSNALHALMHLDSAAAWRYLFWQSLVISPKGKIAMEVAIGGHPEDVNFVVATHLHEHGVVREQGKDSVRQAVHSKRPWRQLKILADEHKPPVKIIKQEELQSVIHSRAKSGQSFGNVTTRPKTLNPFRQLLRQVIYAFHQECLFWLIRNRLARLASLN